jgi:dTMP kinase
MRQRLATAGEHLADRPFRLLLTGHGVSSLGDWVATFGLMLFVRNLTKGSSIQGLAISGILGFRILPALIAAPIASSVTDRFDRRRTMIVADVSRAALIALVPFTPNLAAVYTIAFFLEGMSLIFLPARDALVPNIVPRQRLAGANAAIMLLQWGTIPVAGGLVVAQTAGAQALIGTPVIGFLARQRFALPFFFDAVTFLVSAWAIAWLPSELGRIGRTITDPDHNPFHVMRSDMGQGTRFLLSDRGRRNVIIGTALATGAGGALFALGIPYVKTTLHTSDSIFGAMIALWGVGMALGAYAAQKSPMRESDLFRLGLGGSGVILVLMALIPHPWLAMVVSVPFGAGLSVAMVLGITVAQRVAPPELRGRVMSAIHVLVRICLIGGSVIVGGLAAAFTHVSFLPGWDGNRYAFVVAGASLVAAGAAARSGATLIETETKSEHGTEAESEEAAS